MDDRDDREDWKREHSLLALGQAMRGDEAQPRSLLSIVGQNRRPVVSDDAAARHRLARSRRQAMANPLLSALATAPQVQPAQATAPEHQAWADDPGMQENPAGDDRRDEQEKQMPDWFWAEPAASAATTAESASDPGLFEEDNGRRDIEYRKHARAPALRGIARSKGLIAAMAMLGLALGTAVALTLPTVYDATAEIVVAPRHAVVGQADAAVASELRVLKSGIVLNKAVDKLNLADDPEFNGRQHGASGVLSLMRSLLLRDDAADDGGRHALAVGNLAESLMVARGSGAYGIAVTVRTGSAEKSALIANSVADAFVETYGTLQPAGEVSAIDPSDPADGAKRALRDFARAHGLAGKQAVDDLLALDDQVSAARTRTRELNAKVAALRATGVEDAVGGGLPREFESGAMAELRLQYLTLRQEADRAAVRLGPRNPERRALDAQLAGAHDRIGAELRRIVASLQSDLKSAVQSEQRLSSRLAQADLGGEDIAKLRDLETAARQVDRQLSTASIAIADENEAGGGARVVSRAFAPLESSGPSRPMLALGGLLLGLAAGTGLGVLRAGPAQADEGPGDVQPAGRRAPIEKAWNLPRLAADIAEEDRGTDDLPLSVMDGQGFDREAVDARLYEPAASDSAETPYLSETATMYPSYPEQSHPFEPQQPGDEARQRLQPAPYPPAAYSPYAPPHPMQQAVHPMQAMPSYYAPHPYLYAQQPGYPPAWQMQPPPPPGYPYPQPAPAYAAQPMPPFAAPPYPQPAFAPSPEPHPEPVVTDDQNSIEEIRASLREFREAVRELTESRSRRRYF